MWRLLLLRRACRAAAAAPKAVELLRLPSDAIPRLQHGWWSGQLGPASLAPGGFCTHQLAVVPRSTEQLEATGGDVDISDAQHHLPVVDSALSSSGRGSSVITTDGSNISSSSAATSGVSTAEGQPSSAELQRMLLSAGLQYSSVMSVVKMGANYSLMPSNPQVLAERAQQLVQHFGEPLANKILRQDPELLMRLPASLIRNWEGICQMLQLAPDQALQLLERAPLLMNNKPEAVLERSKGIQEVLQLDNATLKRLLIKVPNMLRASLARLEESVPFLCSVTGLSPAQLVRAFTAWPVLGTTKVDTLKERYATLQVLLGANSQQMERVCRHWPNLLARDHAQLVNNMATLSERLNIPLEELKVMVLDEPGLLNYNVSTLANKIHDVTMTLRLPRKVQLTLLTYNRALLTCSGSLNERLLFLQTALGVDEEVLFPLVHKYPSILRFPPEVCQAKLATAAALAATHPGWQAQWEVRTPLRSLRIMQASWATLWRAAYLRSTGQADTCSMVQAVTTKHSTFARNYPDFLPWLNRYNAHAEGPSLPPSGGPLQANQGSKSKPNIYSPVIPLIMDGKMLHAGSLYRRHRQQQQQQQEDQSSGAPLLLAQQELQQQGQEQQQQQGQPVQQATGTQEPSASTGGMQQQQQQPEEGQPAQQAVAASQAGLLACLLDISEQQAEELLAVHGQLRKVSWRDWGLRLRACEELLVCLGLLSEQASGAGSMSSPLDGSSSSTVMEDHAAASPVLAAQQAGAAVDITHPPELNPTALERRVLRAVPGAEELLVAAEAAAATACRVESHPPRAAVAAATVALNLAEFSPQLCQAPAAVPPLVAQLVLENPRAFMPKKGPAMTESCRLLQLLVKQHPAAREELLEQGIPGLARLVGFPLRRVAFVEFLLQTGEPWPWRVPLRLLLTADSFTKIKAPYQQAFKEWQQRQEAAAQVMMLLPPTVASEDNA